MVLSETFGYDTTTGQVLVKSRAFISSMVLFGVLLAVILVILVLIATCFFYWLLKHCVKKMKKCNRPVFKSNIVDCLRGSKNGSGNSSSTKNVVVSDTKNTSMITQSGDIELSDVQRSRELPSVPVQRPPFYHKYESLDLGDKERSRDV